jgi:hypothetical protein
MKGLWLWVIAVVASIDHPYILLLWLYPAKRPTVTLCSWGCPSYNGKPNCPNLFIFGICTYVAYFVCFAPLAGWPLAEPG